MRLLRVDDLGFEDVPSHGSCPGYAILSHTWIHPRHNEVSLQDMLNIQSSPETVKQKAGWAKLSYLINQARRSNLRYVWMDTCCINQSNPTELTEAINCMFNWYSGATVCYVYLDDVDLVMERDSHFQYSQQALDLFVEALQQCRWVRRGWTLQELLAPTRVLFFDKSWTFLIGSADGSQILAQATSVDIDMLAHKRPLYSYSIAQRLSWASYRTTTFPEDRAYSLVGLFGITMTTHYGEGDRRAFERLQEEIVKISTDQSLFAWRGSEDSLLAPSLHYFRDRGHIVPRRGQVPVSYHIDNIGLQIDLCATRTFALLDCRSLYDPSMIFLLRLRPDPSGHFMLDPARRCEEIDWRTLRHREQRESFVRRSISIRKSAAPHDWSDAGRICDSNGPWHLKLRLESPRDDNKDMSSESGALRNQSALQMAAVQPVEDWNMTYDTNSFYYKPSSVWKLDGPLQGTSFCVKWLNSAGTSDGHESQAPFWRYATIAFAYGQRSAYSQVANAPLPAVYAQKTRDTRAIEEARSHVSSQQEQLSAQEVRSFESLPLTRCLWYRQRFSRRNLISLTSWFPQWQQLRITLDKAEISGETFWELDVAQPQDRNAFYYVASHIRSRALKSMSSLLHFFQKSFHWASAHLKWTLLWSWHYFLLIIEWSPLMTIAFATWKVDPAPAIPVYFLGLLYCDKTGIGRPRVILTFIVASRFILLLKSIRGDFWIWLSTWLRRMPQYQTRSLPWSQIWRWMCDVWRWAMSNRDQSTTRVGKAWVVASLLLLAYINRRIAWRFWVRYRLDVIGDKSRR